MNAILLAVLMYRTNQMNLKTGKSGSKRRKLFGFTSLLLNLGITWSLFALYVHQSNSFSMIFSHVFIILNGSQVCKKLSSKLSKPIICLKFDLFSNLLFRSVSLYINFDSTLRILIIDQKIKGHSYVNLSVICMNLLPNLI